MLKEIHNYIMLSLQLEKWNWREKENIKRIKIRGKWNDKRKKRKGKLYERVNEYSYSCW